MKPSGASRKWACSHQDRRGGQGKKKDKGDKKSAGAAPKAAGGKKKKGRGINIKIPGLGGKVKGKVLTTFTRQLATLVDAGLPLLRGMRVLEKQGAILH